MKLDYTNEPKNTFSANEIRTYGDCPRKRYYTSRDHLALRTATVGGNLALGTIVHKMLQHYYTEADKLLAEVEEITVEIAKLALETIEIACPFVLEKDAIDSENLKVFITIKNCYMEQIAIDLARYSIISCEQNFNMDNWPIDDVRYHGQIDMIVLERGTNICKFFEHKTCKDFRPEIYNRFDVQLHIYSAYGERYCAENGYQWGGMVLNELKKGKTERGYANHRMFYLYSEALALSFFNWIARKTAGAISPTNKHEPCNGYMVCKMCEYAPVCLQYGYEVPQTTDEVLEAFKDTYTYNPREAETEEAE